MTRHLRVLIRLLIVIIAAVPAMQFLPWSWSDVLVSAPSPFISISSAIALRKVALVTLAGIPLFLLALIKGRWFCFHICPPGFLLDCAGRLKPGNKSMFGRVPHIGHWLVMLTLGGAIVGVPLFLWLDPLALFNGFFSVLGRKPMVWMDVLPAAGLCLIAILSVCMPHVWCERICPLGALMGMLGAVSRSFRGKVKTVNEIPSPGKPHGPLSSWGGAGLGRRGFLALLAGAGMGWVLRLIQSHTRMTAIRPPGAVSESQFTGLCTRCGNCIQVCPEHIIVPDMGESGVCGLLTPVLDLSHRYCDEWCNECTKVCPTGAIRNLTLDTKRNLSIGTAYIDKSSCIAWTDGKYCMVCQEYCPFQAITAVEHKGVNCPQVDEFVCRGCGACQSQCPALPVKAIIVQGIAQRKAMSKAGLS